MLRKTSDDEALGDMVRRVGGNALSQLAKFVTIIPVNVGRTSLTVRGVFGTSAFQISTVEARTIPDVSFLQTNNAAKTLSRRSLPKMSTILFEISP